MHSSNAALVRRELVAVKQLPPLSPTASQLLQLLADPDVEVEQLARVIEQDPGLTARVLGLANSAYFGQTRPILRVQEAIIRVLGLNLVKSLSFGIAMAGSFDTRACPRLDMGEYWYRSLAAAVLGRLVAQGVDAGYNLDSDGLYLCGLLHDIGLLLLAHVFPEGLNDALGAWDGAPDRDLLQLERQFLDTDHVLSGEWLARRWHLPEMVGDVIAYRERDDYEGDYATELCIVRGVDGWLRGTGGERHLADIDCLRGLPGLDGRSLSAAEERFLDQADELQALARALV